MTTTVLRFRCDLCAKTYLTDLGARICEAACAEEAALREQASAMIHSVTPDNEEGGNDK